MSSVRPSRADGLPGFLLEVVMAFVGLILIMSGVWFLRMGNSPAWFGWVIIVGGLAQAVRSSIIATRASRTTALARGQRSQGGADRPAAFPEP